MMLLVRGYNTVVWSQSLLQKKKKLLLKKGLRRKGIHTAGMLQHLNMFKFLLLFSLSFSQNASSAQESSANRWELAVSTVRSSFISEGLDLTARDRQQGSNQITRKVVGNQVIAQECSLSQLLYPQVSS